ncbi:MAG: MerR family transcriptional regulator [Clostridiales bacterium]|jgi:DNA-binding transcriptional MerR regulator|nr:MerR family transcriptional regulator [Clostridiales bacterium]
MGYTIKQVSEKTNLSAHVLRYYEKEGLLSRVSRSGSGFRHYSEDDLEWLSLICCLKNTGMSLKQIKDFVDLSAQGGKTLKQRLEMLAEHKKNVEDQINQMHKHLDKVSCKISCFTKQYEEYLQSGTQGGDS